MKPSSSKKKLKTHSIHPRGFSLRAQSIEPPPIAWLMEQKLKRPNLISLAAGFTDPETLPVEETRRIVHAWTQHKSQARAILQYGTGSGREHLRILTARRIADLDQMPSTGKTHDPSRVLITHGSQQFLYLVTEALCDPGDIVLIESPTYFVYLSILKYFGVQSRSIPLQPDGMDIQHLEEQLEALKKSGQIKRLKMIYLVSYFQNPTSRNTSLAKKKAMMDLARRYESAAGHPIYLLEDAAYRELSFGQTPPAPSMLSLPGASKRVIYSGTYSKPFATGIRVGFGISPSPLHQTLCHLKGNQDFGTAEFLQAILEKALASGMYDRHLEVIRKGYAKKSDRMCRMIQRHFPASVSWHPPEGGLYVWARLPQPNQTGPQSALFKASLKANVLYVPGCYAFGDDVLGPERQEAMRLSFGNANLKMIDEGIRRLGEVIQSTMKRTS